MSRPHRGDPAVPEDIKPSDLDREVRGELRRLPRATADAVARHLVAAGRLIDEDPAGALRQAMAARRFAPRIAAVREAVGLAAYHSEDWQTAITELRTYHRISGRRAHLAVIADCERALGRPERAIDLYRTAPLSELAPAEAIELLIVAAGARADLGQRDAAVEMLRVPELDAERPASAVARLRYAYADALLAVGRRRLARDWFARAVAADRDVETDAAERLLELDGVTLVEVEEPEPDRVGSEETAADSAQELAEGQAEDVAERPAADVAEGQAEDVAERPAADVAEGQAADVAEGQAEDVAEGQAEDVAEGPAEDVAEGAEPAEHPVEAPTEQAAMPPTGAPVDGPRTGQRLVDAYDFVIVDLDGTVIMGDQPIPNAAPVIEELRRHGPALCFATNNASRGAEELTALLNRLGIAASAGEVLTSAAATADALAQRLPGGAAVLVVGSDALAAEVGRVGLRPVDTAHGWAGSRDDSEAPAAVVQGYGPAVGWAQLAEASVAIRAGAMWAVTNVDATLPSPRGPLPGNGALVAALRTALGRDPDIVVGKPQPELFLAAARRAGARAPLVVGDRLDTDIEAANRAGMHSLLVLTGVSDEPAARAAPPERRPTYVGADLRTLLLPR